MSPTEGRPPRRMLPSVTDVVNELSRVVKEDPAVLFKVSRQVVAEELGRVKQGFESASIEVLARRARRLLDPAVWGAQSPPPPVPSNLFGAPEPPVPEPPAPEPPAPEPPAPPTRLAPSSEPPAPEPTAAAPALSPDEPFAAPSEVELGWEKEVPIQPDDAPFRSAIPPAGIAPLQAPEPSVGAPLASVRATVALFPPPAVREAPEAEEAEEVEEVEEVEVPPEPGPKPAEGPVSSASTPMASPASNAPAPKPDPASFLRAPAPVVPSAPPPLGSGDRAAPPRSDTRPSLEPPPPADEQQPIRPPEDAAQRGEAPGPLTTREWKALGQIGVVPERFPERAPEPASAPEPAPRVIPPRAGKRAGSGWLIAVAAVLFVGAGLAYVLKDVLFGRPAARPEAPVASEPAHPTPVRATPTPEPSATSPVPAKRIALSSPGKTKGALIVSKEWTGRPVIWVIHFTSHKDRAGAEKEAARLAAMLGKSGHAIEVDLGEKGIWYRVLIGDFATQDEARAYHDELQAKNTPNLGFVYQLKAEE